MPHVSNSSGPWRLSQLVALSRKLVATSGTSGESRRVRWNPTERLVRYYTTLGLVDGPAEMRGRTAYYSQRHILQLMAIKRLQAEGETLEAVQAQLAGLTDEQLQELAQLPENWTEQLEQASPESGVVPRSKQPFWKQAAPEQAWVVKKPKATSEFGHQGIELAPGMILMVNTATYPNLDAASVRAAASELIRLANGELEGDQE